MKMKRKSTAVLVAALVAACGLWFALRPSKQTGITLETAATSRITIRNSVTATGTVEPVTEVEVGTQVSGIIDRLYVDYNDVVKAGQLIAEMDKVTLQAELESSQAELASCKTEYEYRMKEYSRTRTLHEKELVSDAEYDEALYLYEKARNAYEQAQAAIVKVKRNLGYATITSPIDGVVISRAVEEGQTVAAGFETPTLFTIANDLTQMQVVADVDEADIGQVSDGQRVEFTVDAYPDDTFEGVVEQVRLEATTESSVVTYEVVITAYNPELKLKPGLTANVTIFTLEGRCAGRPDQSPAVRPRRGAARGARPACRSRRRGRTKQTGAVGKTRDDARTAVRDRRLGQRRTDRDRRRAERRRGGGRLPDGGADGARSRRRTESLHACPSGRRQKEEINP